MAASVSVQRFYARIMADGVPIVQALSEERERCAAGPGTAPPPVRMPLLAQLWTWRQTWQLSQVQMARLCHVSLSTYRQWEGGHHYPQYRSQRRIRSLVAQPPPKAYQAAEMTLRARILAVLRSLPTGAAHYRRIADGLEEPSAHVRTACHLMTKDGRLRWESPGVYAVVERRAS